MAQQKQTDMELKRKFSNSVAIYLGEKGKITHRVKMNK